MDLFRKIRPEWLLRLGFGLMYLYSGSDLFYNPEHWYGFVPQWFSQSIIVPVISMDTYLRLQGVGEFVMGLLFLAWFSHNWGIRIASFLASVELALIVLLVGINHITFRDIGLVGAALSLFILSFRKQDANGEIHN